MQEGGLVPFLIMVQMSSLLLIQKIIVRKFDILMMYGEILQKKHTWEQIIIESIDLIVDMHRKKKCMIHLEMSKSVLL